MCSFFIRLAVGAMAFFRSALRGATKPTQTTVHKGPVRGRVTSTGSAREDVNVLIPRISCWLWRERKPTKTASTRSESTPKTLACPPVTTE